MRLIDMTGKTYEQLTVISRAGKDRRGQILWLCQCTCGRKSVANGYDIRNGHTQSCGHCRQSTYETLDDCGITVVTIPGGTFFAIDSTDEETIKLHSWYIGGNGYVVTNINSRRVYLHKMLLGVDNNTLVDHINRDKMDNRKSNLRHADKSLNAANAGLRRDNTVTKHKNIKFDKRYNTFIVRIVKDGVPHYCGRYKNLFDAVRAANEHRVNLFGEFAYYDDYICPLIGKDISSLDGFDVPIIADAASGPNFGEMTEME